MTTASNTLRTMSIFRFRTLENNLKFLNQTHQNTYKMTCDSKINLCDNGFLIRNDLKVQFLSLSIV